jgi:hypothetical protein
MINELEIWKEAVVAYFKTLTQNVPAGTEKNPINDLS